MKAAQTVFQLFVGNLQVHNRADRGQMFHGLVRIDSRTTRSNDGVARGKRAQHFIFHFDKAIRTACIDNLLQCLVELALNKQVGIDEFIAKDLRQNNAQG